VFGTRKGRRGERKEIRGIGICAQFGYVERKIKGEELIPGLFISLQNIMEIRRT